MVDPVVAVLIVAGLQVPVILLVEVAGNTGGVEFWLSGPICVKVGVICVVISISIVVFPPHWPAFGVNVYVTFPTVAVLIVVGLHVPVILLVEVAGNVGGVEF